MTLQESDCAFTAFDQRSISNNHSTSLKEKELRKGVAMPSNATLLFDASTSESTIVTTSSSRSAFRNFATISSWIRACREAKSLSENIRRDYKVFGAGGGLRRAAGTPARCD